MPARGYSVSAPRKKPKAKAKSSVGASVAKAGKPIVKAQQREAKQQLKRDLGALAQTTARAKVKSPALHVVKFKDGKLGSSKAKSFNAAPGKLLRVAGHTVSGIGEAVYHDPLGAGEKAARQASEIAKGVASSAIALPIYTATYPVKKALGKDGKDDDPWEIAKRMVDAEAGRVSKTYGPSFRGEKGARKKLAKQIEKEGALVPALDLSLAAGPTSLAVGAGARGASLARVARGGKPIKGVTRPKVRVSPHGEAVQPKQRTGAIRMAGEATVDTARKVAQKRAVKRAQPTTTRKGVVKEGKPLAGRRATLKPGEVTPIIPAVVNRKLRLSVADDVSRGEAAATARVKRHVTDAKPNAESIRVPFKKLPEADHHAAITAAQLGIKDAKGARAIIPARIAEIERTIAEAGAKKTHPDRAAAMHGGHDAELTRLRAYMADPKVFERADVQTAADAVRKPVVGAREGLSTQRAAEGRAGLVGPTLGVKPAKQVNLDRSAAAVARAKVAKRTVQQARATVAKAEADLRVAKARHPVGSPKRAAAEAKLATAKALARTARQERKAANAPLARVEESATAYEARVAAAAAERGLAPPAHVPSKYAPDEGLRVQRPQQGQANPLGRERSGTLYRTGHEDKSLATLEQNRAAALKRGARLEAESNVLAKHGKSFRSEREATAWAKAHGMDTGPDADMQIYKPRASMVRKGLARPRTTPGGKPQAHADAGAYVKTDDVFLVPKAVRDELLALDAVATTAPGAIRKAASLSQSALLAFSPSWFQFQRVNDVVAATIGGSLPSQRHLQQIRKSLDPDSREVLDIVSGGSMSREMLTPHSAAKMGAVQRILDENPTYRQAFATKKPATILLRVGADIPTGLLRADQAVTAGFRQRQMIHNLQQVAAKMDPDVSTIHRAFAPLGRAFTKGDPQQIAKLLKDPKYRAQVEEAAAKLNDVMGNWHTYTAREQRVRASFAFYGFLRYATRMAFITLPLGHPTMGALVAQLGIMGAEDAKQIVGPDMPWGIGALYNKDGTIAADFARANPLTGPLLSINKPEQLVGLATPLASIVVSYILNQPVGLSDSATGYIAQYTVNKNPKDHAAGGFLGEDRLRIALRNVMGLLTPLKEWQRYDNRQQSDDSLPWDRRYLASHEPAGALKIDAQNAARAADGMEGLRHNLLPLAFPASKKNAATQGALVTRAKVKAAQTRELEQIKRKIALETPEGQMDLEIKKLKAELDREDPDLAAMDFEIAKLKAELGAP